LYEASFSSARMSPLRVEIAAADDRYSIVVIARAIQLEGAA
jgi:hypothetical protein